MRGMSTLSGDGFFFLGGGGGAAIAVVCSPSAAAAGSLPSPLAATWVSIGSLRVISLIVFVICVAVVVAVVSFVSISVVFANGFDDGEAFSAAKSVEEEDKTHLNDDGVEMYSVE